jgi:predicted RNA binding protein YcfA (HicA-like mRNA interferase family)
MPGIDIRGITCRDTRDAVHGLLTEGWEAVRWTGGNHLLLRHTATGACLAVGSTPSSTNTANKILAAARREVRHATNLVKHKESRP